MLKLTSALGFLFCLPLFAQTYNTSCVLYPTTAYCTTIQSDGGAAVAAAESQQQYQAGYAAGNSIGMAIFRAHFPGWRRKYCSTHPEQPFYYGNSQGDSITGTCPTLEVLAYQAASEFHAKHPTAIQSEEHAKATLAFIATNKLPDWEPKSYEKAAKATEPKPGKKKK